MQITSHQSHDFLLAGIGEVHRTGRACFVVEIRNKFLFRDSKDRAGSTVTSNKNGRSKAKECIRLRYNETK